MVKTEKFINDAFSCFLMNTSKYSLKSLDEKIGIYTSEMLNFQREGSISTKAKIELSNQLETILVETVNKDQLQAVKELFPNTNNIVEVLQIYKDTREFQLILGALAYVFQFSNYNSNLTDKAAELLLNYKNQNAKYALASSLKVISSLNYNTEEALEKIITLYKTIESPELIEKSAKIFREQGKLGDIECINKTINLLLDHSHTSAEKYCELLKFIGAFTNSREVSSNPKLLCKGLDLLSAYYSSDSSCFGKNIKKL